MNEKIKKEIEVFFEYIFYGILLAGSMCSVFIWSAVVYSFMIEGQTSIFSGLMLTFNFMVLMLFTIMHYEFMKKILKGGKKNGTRTSTKVRRS